MAKVFTANFRDLGGASNPTGIMSPRYLYLKKALESGNVDEAKAALFAWLEDKGLGRGRVEALLDMEPDIAFRELVAMLKAGLKPESLPKDFAGTLKRVLAMVAGDYSTGQELELAKQKERIGGIRKRFGAAPDTRTEALHVVAKLLGDE